MKAAVYTRYGPPDVVELKEVPKPMPGDGDVLIRIHATTVASGDWRARSLELPPGFGLVGRLVFGMFRPKFPILGTELAGEVEAVGKDVTKFKPGDQVFAMSGARFGCHAEYRALPEDGPIALKPANLSYQEAAALAFGGTAALDFLKLKGKVQSGEKVLVNGASGATGSAAVQLARHFGAEVTGVCSTANLELVRSLGADHVIDYTKEDFTENGLRYDIIVDCAGTAPWARAKGALSDTGRLVLILGSLSDMLRAPFVSRAKGKKLISGVAGERAEDLRFLAGLAEAGEFKPVIDQVFAFDDIRAAHARVDSGHKRGSVVVDVAGDTA